MQVTSKWLDGMCFVGTTANGHSVVMEGAAAEGEVKRGPSPVEMLLLGVAGCSSIDVGMIACLVYTPPSPRDRTRSGGG
ncbi:hypothetical protein ACTHTW_11005, partial [Neisseria sp. P0018.S006]